MSVKRLQKQIAGSRRVLLVTIVCVVMILMAGGLLRQQLWLQLSALALSTYLMFLLDKANVLLRFYSQLVPASFLMLVMVANLIFPSVQSTVVQVSFVGYYLSGLFCRRIYILFLCLYWHCFHGVYSDTFFCSTPVASP